MAGTDNLLKLYEQILDYAGLEVNKEGLVSIGLSDDPCLIDGARLVLPTDIQLRSPAPGEKEVFHPLCERMNEGESKVIGKLRNVINVRLNYTTGIIGFGLLLLAASAENHKKLNPEQLQLMLELKDVTETTCTSFRKILEAGMKAAPDRMFVNIFLSRGGTVNGQRFSRAGIVVFDIMKQLEEDKPYGVKVTQKDKASIIKLMEFIFPGINLPEAYNVGSMSKVAPFLEALLFTSAQVSSKLNDLIAMYSDFIDDADKLTFSSEWEVGMQDLDGLRLEIQRIPDQTRPVAATSQNIATNIPSTPAQVFNPTTAVVQPTIPAYQQPPNMYGQQPVAPNKIQLNQNGKADFNALRAISPILNSDIGNYAAPQQQQQNLQMQQQRVPSWKLDADMTARGGFNGGVIRRF